MTTFLIIIIVYSFIVQFCFTFFYSILLALFTVGLHFRCSWKIPIEKPFLLNTSFQRCQFDNHLIISIRCSVVKLTQRHTVLYSRPWSIRLLFLCSSRISADAGLPIVAGGPPPVVSLVHCTLAALGCILSYRLLLVFFLGDGFTSGGSIDYCLFLLFVWCCFVVTRVFVVPLDG